MDEAIEVRQVCRYIASVDCNNKSHDIQQQVT